LIVASRRLSVVVATLFMTAGKPGGERMPQPCGELAATRVANQRGLTKRFKSTKIQRMNCLHIRIALIISIIHRMVG
jgi:hypothetical protein